MPNRQERIETIIKKNITEIIQYKIHDSHLGFVTITEVKVSKDFSHAKVYASFILDKDKAKGMETLNKAKGFIRTELSKTIDIRRCPDITFVLDDGYEKEQRIEDALARAKK